MGIAKDYVSLLNARLGLKMQVVNNISWTQAVERAKKKEMLKLYDNVPLITR
jgi:hypothetical protein